MAQRKQTKPELEEEPVVEETAIPDPPALEEPQVEETAVPDPPAPKKETAPKKKTVSPAELVWVRLDGAETAVIGHKVILQGEVMQVQYQHYTQAASGRPGVLAVKLPGADKFVTE